MHSPIPGSKSDHSSPLHLPGAPQVHIARIAALAPGGHPVGIGPGALPAMLDHLHLPYMQVLQPGLEPEGPRPVPGPSPPLLAAFAFPGGKLAGTRRPSAFASLASSWASLFRAFLRSPEGVRCMEYGSMALYLIFMKMP